MRNLATVQIIKSIEDIPGKDKIGLASFMHVGFKVIVSKTEQKAGDKVIYFEPDSLLPSMPHFEFLRARCWNEKFGGHRIKSMKMGGVFSEGLAVPLAMVGLDHNKYLAGKDVSEILNVKKYDPEALEEKEATARKDKKRGPIAKFFMSFAVVRILVTFFNAVFFPKPDKSWPQFLSKTDETRVQNLPLSFADLQGTPIFVTEKLDGQSVTFAIKGKKFIVCSRNLRLQKDDSKYWKVAEEFKMEEKLRKAVKDYGFDIAVQAENCGPGIQGNKYGFDSVRPFIFNVFNIKDRLYFGIEELKAFAAKYDLPLVPLLEVKTFDWESPAAVIKYADDFSVFGKKVLREGVVIRTRAYLPPERGMSNMWSFKVISPSFIIKSQ